MEQNKQKPWKVLDVIILPACLFAMAMLVVVLYYSATHFVDVYNTLKSFNEKMFFLGTFVAILWAVMEFIKMNIHTFAISYRNIFNGK